MGVLARVGDVADDQHFGDSAVAAVSSREGIVEDHHVGGVGVERRGVGVDDIGSVEPTDSMSAAGSLET